MKENICPIDSHVCTNKYCAENHKRKGCEEVSGLVADIFVRDLIIGTVLYDGDSDKKRHEIRFAEMHKDDILTLAAKKLGIKENNLSKKIAEEIDILANRFKKI